MSVGTNTPPFPVIRQSELAGYRAIQAELAALQRLQKEERRRLLERVESGTPVEPGPLAVLLRRSPQQRLTRGFLMRALGEKRYYQLKKKVEPTTVTFLTITGCPDEACGPGGTGVGSHPAAGRAGHLASWGRLQSP